MERSVNISIALVDDLKIRQRRENEILGICPVCGCKDANFNTAKLRWRCWHCPAKGVIIPEEGYEVKESEEKILDIPKVRELYTSVTNKYHDSITQPVLDYLKGRGLTQQTVDDFRLGFCSTAFYDDYTNPLAEEAGLMYQNYPALTNRVTIPYIVDGVVTDLRGRTLGTIYQYKENTPTYVSLSGSHASRGATFLFNHDVIDKSDVVIITEGEFKAIVGYQYGFPVVATPGIFGWHKEWSNLLKGKEVILAADFDRISGLRSPAYLMTKALASEIPQLKVALLGWAGHTTTGKIDIDSLLSSGNLKTFERAVKGALDARWWLKREETKGYARR
jgi:hypothetical protein